jgi:hypothetical protein
MAKCSFALRFREAKFCGGPSCVFNELGRAAVKKKRFANTGIDHDRDRVNIKLNRCLQFCGA